MFRYNRTRITNNLREDQYIFFTTSRSFLLKVRNVSEKSCRENQNKHFVINKFFKKKLCHLYEIMWKKKCNAGQATDNNTAHAYWMLDI